MNQRLERIATQWAVTSLIAASCGLSACSDKTTPTSGDDAAVTKDVALDTSADTGNSADGAVDAAVDAAADASGSNAAAQASVLAVKQSESWSITGLSAPVQVIRTEANIPHIYAQNRKDLATVLGFVQARDRYFQIELTRRLGLGTISELLGDFALANDHGSRANGSAFVAASLEEKLTPELADVFDGYAAGVNAYIDQVLAGKLPEPSEIGLAKAALGGTAATLMKKWDRHAVAGAAAAIVYNLGYETDDIGRTAAIAGIKSHFAGKPLEALRQTGALADVEYHVTPIQPVSSAAGLGLDLHGKHIDKTVPGVKPSANQATGRAKRSRKDRSIASNNGPLPVELLQRAKLRDQAWQRSSGHDRVNGFGSNSWAVAGTATESGAGILCGDGHLPLSIPSLFWQMGIDDTLFAPVSSTKPAAPPTHQRGLMIPGLPIMAVGTNGGVAWGQTQLVGDITDWYREQIVLDAQGAPKASVFHGANQNLVSVDESFVIADIPAVGSVGRTEVWKRYTTFDGRWLTDIEGTTVDPKTYKPAAGETIVNFSGTYIVPKDTNGDGVVTGIAFDFTGLDKPNILSALEGFGHSADVYEFRDHTRKLVAYSQNVVAADGDGNVFYTGYQAVPCRTYLPRDKDGVWLPGADPKQLIDGTQYPGFTIPLLADGSVDETHGADPTMCAVPFDEYPNSIDPDQGYVVTANNDPGNLSTDNNLRNDKWYIGGPWSNGYRAGTIAAGLQASVATKKTTVDDMGKLQASNRSPLGNEWVPVLLKTLDEAKALASAASTTDDEQRIVALYQAITPSVRDEVIARLQKWQSGQCQAHSGVETFYHKVADGELEDAVATSIFATWFGRLDQLAVEDEGIELWEPWGGDARTRLLSYMRDGRGANNPKGMASWNPATQESAFWDIIDTPIVETSREIMILALVQALQNLGAKDQFATADMSKWLYGLRHGVHFDSILGQVISADSQFAPMMAAFALTPQSAGLALADSFPAGDPRANLSVFPRGGDAFVVDAAGGIDAHDYGSGPVFRMVIAVGKDKTTGQNILPGGQSGLLGNAHFSDQAKLWLANQALPLRYEVEDVVAGAQGREVFSPK